MMEILCTCGWDIPGVEELPAHSHRVRQVLRRLEDGKEVEFQQVHRQYEQRGWETIDVEDTIMLTIPWKKLVKLL